MRVISDWAKTTVDEGQSAYWIRISAPNGIATAATIRNIRKKTCRSILHYKRSI